MAVTCAKCGEELMGAVNRCWRCGTEYTSRSGPRDVPPVRRPPITGPLDGATVAEVVADDQPRAAGGGEAADDPAPARRALRYGSPFAVTGSSADAAPVARPLADALSTAPQAPAYPKHGGSLAGAVLAIVLGLVSLGLAFALPIGALLTASIGLGLGAWWLHSPRRGAAIFGLLLCCLALAAAAFCGAVDLYTYIYGFSPWETGQPLGP